MPIQPNPQNLAEHIGQYITVARKIRPEKIVSATKAEVKTENGVRIRFTADRLGRTMVAQIGAPHHDPCILTDEELAERLKEFQTRRAYAASRGVAHSAAKTLLEATRHGIERLTVEQLDEIADKINAMFDGNP